MNNLIPSVKTGNPFLGWPSEKKKPGKELPVIGETVIRRSGELGIVIASFKGLEGVFPLNEGARIVTVPYKAPFSDGGVFCFGSLAIRRAGLSGYFNYIESRAQKGCAGLYPELLSLSQVRFANAAAPGLGFLPEDKEAMLETPSGATVLHQGDVVRILGHMVHAPRRGKLEILAVGTPLSGKRPSVVAFPLGPKQRGEARPS